MDHFGHADGFDIQQVNLHFFVQSLGGDDIGPFLHMGSVVHLVLRWCNTCPFGNTGALSYGLALACSVQIMGFGWHVQAWKYT